MEWIVVANEQPGMGYMPCGRRGKGSNVGRNSTRTDVKEAEPKDVFQIKGEFMFS